MTSFNRIKRLIFFSKNLKNQQKSDRIEIKKQNYPKQEDYVTNIFDSPYPTFIYNQSISHFDMNFTNWAAAFGHLGHFHLGTQIVLQIKL